MDLIKQQQAKDLFREAVPKSNYEECKGCHTGSKKCIVVHTLYKICPCSKCIVKTSCTDYCKEYIYSIRSSAARHKPGKMIISQHSNKGYAGLLKYRGKRIHFKVEIWRYINSRRKQLKRT